MTRLRPTTRRHRLRAFSGWLLTLLSLEAQAESPPPDQGNAPSTKAESAGPSAPERSYDLVWDAPKECPSAQDLRSWLAAIVPDASLGAALRVEVRISVSKRGYLATISLARAGTVEKQSEVREVEGPHCDEVARSAVVVASVQIAELALPSEEPGNAPTKAPEEKTTRAPDPPPRAPTPPHAEEPATPAPEKSAARSTIDIDLLLGVGTGFPERPAFRVDVASHLSITKELSVGLRAQVIPYVELARTGSLGALTLVAPGPELCYLNGLAKSARLGLCSRVALGYASATGSGRQGRSDTGALGTLALSPTLAVGNSFSFLVQGDIEYRYLRPRSITSAETELISLPEVAVSGLVGVKMEMF